MLLKLLLSSSVDMLCAYVCEVCVCTIVYVCVHDSV